MAERSRPTGRKARPCVRRRDSRRRRDGLKRSQVHGLDDLHGFEDAEGDCAWQNEPITEYHSSCGEHALERLCGLAQDTVGRRLGKMHGPWSAANVLPLEQLTGAFVDGPTHDQISSAWPRQDDQDLVVCEVERWRTGAHAGGRRSAEVRVVLGALLHVRDLAELGAELPQVVHAADEDAAFARHQHGVDLAVGTGSEGGKLAVYARIPPDCAEEGEHEEKSKHGLSLVAPGEGRKAKLCSDGPHIGFVVSSSSFRVTGRCLPCSSTRIVSSGASFFQCRPARWAALRMPFAGSGDRRSVRNTQE